MNTNYKQNNVTYNDYLEIMVIIEYVFAKKKEKNIPFERGDIIIVLRKAVIVHTHKKHGTFQICIIRIHRILE